MYESNILSEQEYKKVTIKHHVHVNIYTVHVLRICNLLDFFVILGKIKRK